MWKRDTGVSCAGLFLYFCGILEILLRMSICSRYFCKKIVALLWKNCTIFFIQNIVHHYPLLFPIFLIAYKISVEKSRHLLRLPTNQFIFRYLHMKRISTRIGRMSSKQVVIRPEYQESTAEGRIGLSTSAFPIMFWRLVRYEIEHCHAGELLCHVFAHIAFFFQCFKYINWSRYRFPVMISLDWSSS